MPSYGKVITTIFSLMTVNFGWNVGTFLRGTQVDTAFRLKELKAENEMLTRHLDNIKNKKARFEQEKKDMLITVDNIGKENANAFVSNIPKFMNFLKDAEVDD